MQYTLTPLEKKTNYIETLKNASKKSLIDKISTRLLELEFLDNYSVKSKYLKRILRKILPTL